MSADHTPIMQEYLRFPPTPSASIAGRTMQESVYKPRVEPRRLFNRARRGLRRARRAARAKASASGLQTSVSLREWPEVPLLPRQQGAAISFQWVEPCNRSAAGWVRHAYASPSQTWVWAGPRSNHV